MKAESQFFENKIDKPLSWQERGDKLPVLGIRDTRLPQTTNIKRIIGEYYINFMPVNLQLR